MEKTRDIMYGRIVIKRHLIKEVYFKLFWENSRKLVLKTWIKIST